MSTDRDTTRIVRSWLRADESESADRVLDSVLDRLDTTPQRRPKPWPAWRFPPMNNSMKLGLAAAVAVLAAVLGFNYLVAPNVGGPPTPEESAVPLPAGGSLAPGSYVITDISPLEITITVPSGWVKNVARAVVWTGSSNASLGFMTVDNLYVDPCDRSLGQLDPPLGPTVEDFVTALADIPGIEAGEPTATQIDGNPATLVELTGVRPLDDCVGGDASLWTFGGAPWTQAPEDGQSIRVWAVEVGGERLVIVAQAREQASSTERTSLDAIVDSIEIDTP